MSYISTGPGQAPTAGNMERAEGPRRRAARTDEGVRSLPPEGVGPGDCGLGDAEEGPAPQSPSVPVDQQLQPILRDHDAHHRRDHHQRL